MPDNLFAAALAASAGMIDRQLSALMDRLEAATLSEGRRRLIHAMRHATLGSGKRIRPFLVTETASKLARTNDVDSSALLAALSVELIHCYSLVHDDLPSMDNDLLRRGQPTVHVAFGEATAVLVGDGLQALAFELIGDVADPALGQGLLRILAGASGEAGMVGGQMLDLAAEGRFAADRKVIRLPLEGIAEVQSLKTGALIIAAVEMGALCGGLLPHAPAFQALSRYGAHLGRAFQIADDIIDATGDAETAGKAVAKDEAAGKATFVSTLGLAGARERLAEEISQGENALAEVPSDLSLLRALIRSMAGRRN